MTVRACWVSPVAAATSGFLLGITFLDARAYLLTWCAFVPLFWCHRQATTLLESYRDGFLFGMFFFVTAANWIVDFAQLFKGYGYGASWALGALFWFYSAQLFALACVLCHWLGKRITISDVLMLPVMFTLFITQFPMLFSPLLGGTQINFLWALQALDLLGENALIALIVMVNVIVLECALRGVDALRMRSVQWGFCILACWMGYGAWASAEWDSRMAQWKTINVGLVQPNEQPRLGQSDTVAGYSRTFPQEMEMTQRLADAGADWVIWPEVRYKGYFDRASVQVAFAGQIKKMQVPLLFQDLASGPVNDRGKKIYRNGAVMLNATGDVFPAHYKMKRVAFGEYIPLLDDSSFARQQVEAFFGAFTTEIKAGMAPAHFQLQDFNVQPLICFEVMFPVFVADVVRGHAAGTILAVLSSNGWFGDTKQPYQHLYGGALRAVENRLPLVHAINNGPSAVVLPNGRIIFESLYHQAGAYLVAMPYSKTSGGSFFTRHPTLFQGFCWSAAALFVLLAFWGKHNVFRKALPVWRY